MPSPPSKFNPLLSKKEFIFYIIEAVDTFLHFFFNMILYDIADSDSGPFLWTARIRYLENQAESDSPWRLCHLAGCLQLPQLACSISDSKTLAPSSSFLRGGENSGGIDCWTYRNIWK